MFITLVLIGRERELRQSLEIREATLADAPGITAVHCSTVTVWRDPATGAAVPYTQLDLYGRWRNGGPWMSVELATVHLQSLLRTGQLPLVALWNGEVVGEAEYYLTHEPEPYAALHLSILYVHADWQGRGIGRALFEAGLQRARAWGLPALTTQPEAEAQGFYARLGFVPWRVMQELQVRTAGAEQPPATLERVRAVESQPEPSLALRIGRYQCGPQGWEVLWPVLELPGWSDLRRAVWRGLLASGPAVLGLCQQLTDPTQADAYVWVAPSASLVPALTAVRTLAAAEGYQAVDVLLAVEDLPALRPHFRFDFQTQLALWRRAV